MGFYDSRRLIIFVDGYTQNRDVVMKWMRAHNFQAHRQYNEYECVDTARCMCG
tara:strand:+ start:1083 stop:1241 length:159 start_codon:yes stop_codon:yes gene_type:complete